MGKHAPMKEQEKSVEKERNEMEANNVLDKEFKVVVRMLQELRDTMDELSETLKR